MKCSFCEEYIRPLDNDYYNTIGRKAGYPVRILAQSDNWYAIPTLGCMTVGYVLVICKHHYLSIASLPDNLFFEMMDFKKYIEEELFKHLGLKCIAFEHGTTSYNYSSANSVDHVHLHVVPFGYNIWSEIVQRHSIDEYLTFSNYEELFAFWKKKPPQTYLLFQDLNEKVNYIPSAEGYPSQFFRQCLSYYFDNTSWDWRNNYQQINIFKTIKLFQ